MPDPAVFFSLYCYAVQRVVEPDRWADFVTGQLNHKNIDECELGFQSVRACQSAFPTVLALDGSTLIAKARSRMAGVMLDQEYQGNRFEADVWVQCDEDVAAGSLVLRRLVAKCRKTRGLVVAPCMLRQARKSNVVDVTVPEDVKSEDELVPITMGGTGLCAVHVDALRKAADVTGLCTDGQGGAPFPPLFLETVRDGVWVGEDVAFCHRLRAANVDLYALTDALTVHAGKRCKLGRDGTVYGDAR